MRFIQCIVVHVAVVVLALVKGNQWRLDGSREDTRRNTDLVGPHIRGFFDLNSFFFVPVDYRTEKAVEYLKFYGYLRKDLGTSDESVTKALTLFQQWAHVNETGELDDATWTMMHEERCGMPDVITVSRRRRRYALHGTRWRKGLISYCLKSYPDEMSFPKEDVDSTIAKSFMVWASVCSLEFQRFKKCPADIVIEFRKGEHGDGSPFDGRGGTLAHAYFPGNNGRGIYGDIHFDDAELWTMAKHRRGFENLFCTAVHEIGHSLGLRHSRKKGAVMWPWAQSCEDKPLTYDDISGIQALYGPPRSDPTQTTLGRKPLQPSTLIRVQPTSALLTPDDIMPNFIPEAAPVTTSEPRGSCDGTIDAITVAADGNTYGFRGPEVFLFTLTGVVGGYPRPISSVFPKGPSSVDAALTITYRTMWFPFRITYLFMGPSVWAYKFEQGTFVLHKNPTSITKEFAVKTNKIDSAFYLYRDDRFYLATGSSVWEMELDKHQTKISAGRLQSKEKIAELRDVPSFTAAFHWINDKVYFFQKASYYRLERWFWFLRLSGPRNTARLWFGCNN